MKHGFIDKYSELNSVIHNLNPSLKILISLFFVVIISQTNIFESYKFILYFTLITAFVFISKVPLKYVLKKSILVIPFVGFIIFFRLFKSNLSIAEFNNGIYILAKAWLCFLVLIMLSSTTRFNLLMEGLSKLKFPQIMIMILNFMYRYIFVFIDEIQRMNRARKLRYFKGSIFLKFKILGNIIAILYLRAYERAEKVYLSMVMRGFDGSIRNMETASVRTEEIILGSLFCLVVLLIYFIKI